MGQNYCESPTETGRAWWLFKRGDKLAMNGSRLEGASKNIYFPLQTVFKWTPGFVPVRGGTSREAEHSKLPALTPCTCFTQLQGFITEQRHLKYAVQREVPHEPYKEVELCHISESVDANKRVWKWLLIPHLLLLSTSNSIYICVNCI